MATVNSSRMIVVRRQWAALKPGVLKWLHKHLKMPKEERALDGAPKKWLRTRAMVLDTVKLHPGLSGREYADALPFADSTVVKYLQQMAREGVVENLSPEPNRRGEWYIKENP